MSTQPPNINQDEFARPAPPAKMAVAQATKAKPASSSRSKNANPKAKSQMHRRSRTGCYTCRLRRKKCDEGIPFCTACKHLGLQCDYKRPMWWGNNDLRRQQKDDIKEIIKRKKLAEKSQQAALQTSMTSPPGLSHSLPTSATFSDSLDRTRSASIDSHFSTAFNFNSPPNMGLDFNGFSGQMHPDFMFGGGGFSSPYEVDVKTERQVYMNDVPTLRESHVSTFSTYSSPPLAGAMLPSSVPMDGGQWTEQVCSERKESLSEEALNLNFFDFSHGPSLSSRQVAVELDENDQRLLDHFIQFVLPTIFPILESNQHGSVGSDLILPALQSNEGYLHCCLSIAAQHYKATMNLPGEEIDQDIMRHRYTTISSLCEALKRDENHQQILEAALGLIFFQCVVGRSDDSLPDIPWHQHFQAAVSLVQKLDLPRLVSEPSAPEPSSQTPFNMTLTAWIDILGATMRGQAPIFAHTYREKHLSATNSSLGLRELMGCQDRVMYLISEIACLDALKRDGMDDITICQHVHALGEQIGLTEEAGGADNAVPKMPFNASGTLSPKQLSKNMTAAFRYAARIYLCSLVPGFNPAQSSCVGLVDKLTTVLQHIPSGPAGFDRSLAWVYLIGGGVSLPDSPFRRFFDERVAELGDVAGIGSFGRVASLLREVWAQTAIVKQQSPVLGCSSNNAGAGGGSGDCNEGNTEPVPYIHWRDVMQMKGWDYLLI